MKSAPNLVLALCTAALAAPAAAQFAKAEDAIKYRQSALTVLGTHFAHLGAMADGKIAYDAPAAAANADVVLLASRLPWHAFGPGTDKGRETAARPEIWQQPDKFRERSQAMQAQVADALVPAARSGNLDQLKAAFGPTARSCKACHDDFRRKR